MNWENHLFYGVLAGAILIFTTRSFGWYDVSSIKEVLILFTTLGVSPLIPDLDHPMGKLHHIFLQIGGAILAVGFIDVFAVSLGAVQGMRLLLTGSTLILITLLIGYAAEHQGFWYSMPV